MWMQKVSFLRSCCRVQHKGGGDGGGEGGRGDKKGTCRSHR